MQRNSGNEAAKDSPRLNCLALVILLFGGVVMLSFIAAVLVRFFGGEQAASIKPATPSAEVVRLANGIELLHTLNSSLTLCAWTDEGRTLVTVGQDDTLQVWDVIRGELIRASVPISSTGGPVCSQDGHWAAVSVLTNTISLVDVDTGEIVRTLEPQVPPGVWVPSGGTISEASYADRESYPVMWSNDGRELLTATNIAVRARGLQSTDYRDRQRFVQRWNTQTGRFLASTNLNLSAGSLLEQIATAPDGSVVAVAKAGYSPNGSYMNISLWDTHSGALRSTVRIDDYSPQPLHWSPDGRSLAVVLGRQVKLIDSSSAQVVLSLPEVLPPRYTPTANTGRRVRTRSAGSIPVLPGIVNTRQPGPVPTTPPKGYVPPLTPVSLLPAPDSNDYQSVSNVAWSPDGSIFATYDSYQIRFWEIASGKLKGITRHPDTVNDYWSSLGWSADGRLFATLYREGETGVLRLWDGETAAPLRVLATDVYGFHWSPKELKLLVRRMGAPGLELWGITSSKPATTRTP